jgi:hypothetical protein
MKKIALLVSLLLVGGVGANLRASAQCPYNGGFEQIDKGRPVGWNPTSGWFSLGTGAVEGHRALLLAGTCSTTSDRIVSQGYRLVTPGETLSLHLQYASPTGGVVAGLLPCDALGKPLADQGQTVELPFVATWTTFDHDFVLAPEACPAGTAAVRLYFGVLKDGSEGRFDAVTLRSTAAASSGDLAKATNYDPLKRPNLLQNPGFKPSAGGYAGWCALAAEGFAPAASVEDGAPAGLSFAPAELPAAWMSAPVNLNAALPYEIAVQVAPGEGAAQVTALARIRDPRDPAVVWYQAEASPTGDGAAPVVVQMPRLFAQTSPGLVEVGLRLAPGATAPVQVQSASLRPEPLQLAVRPVAMAGDFCQPKDVTLFVSVVNSTSKSLAPMAYLKVFDAGGQTVSYEARPIRLGPLSAAYFPIKPTTIKGAGEYTLLVRVVQNGLDLGSTTYPFRVTGG